MNSVNHVFEARHILSDSYMILSGSCLIIIIVRVCGNCIASFASALIGFIMCSDGSTVFYFFFLKRCPSVDSMLREFLFENQPARFEDPLHAPFRVLFFCLFALYIGENLSRSPPSLFPPSHFPRQWHCK